MSGRHDVSMSTAQAIAIPLLEEVAPDQCACGKPEGKKEGYRFRLRVRSLLGGGPTLWVMVVRKSM
jgi:hypothetical protein